MRNQKYVLKIDKKSSIEIYKKKIKCVNKKNK